MYDHKTLRLVYQVRATNIEFLKSQQWRICYYATLAQGGVAAFSSLSEIKISGGNSNVLHPVLGWLLLIMSFVILCLFVHQVWLNLKELSEERSYQAKALRILSPEIQNDFAPDQTEKRYTKALLYDFRHAFLYILPPGAAWFLVGYHLTRVAKNIPVAILCCAPVVALILVGISTIARWLARDC